MVKMISLCLDVRRGLQDIEMMLTSPLPFPYVHLVTLLVHFSAVFGCIRTGVLLGTAGAEVAPLRVGFELLLLLSLNALYSGLLCLSVVLTNPFLDQCVDFPAANFQCRLWKSQIFARTMLFRTVDVDRDVAESMDAFPGEVGKVCVNNSNDDADADDDDDDDDDDNNDADC